MNVRCSVRFTTRRNTEIVCGEEVMIFMLLCPSLGLLQGMFQVKIAQKIIATIANQNAQKVLSSILIGWSVLENAYLPHVMRYHGIPDILGIPGIPSILGISGIPGIPGIPGIFGINGIPGILEFQIFLVFQYCLYVDQYTKDYRQK